MFPHTLQGDLTAYQFDRAVYLFGARTEARFEERNEKGQRVRTLEEAMGNDTSSNLADLALSDEEKLTVVHLMLGGIR